LLVAQLGVELSIRLRVISPKLLGVNKRIRDNTVQSYRMHRRRWVPTVGICRVHGAHFGQKPWTASQCQQRAFMGRDKQQKYHRRGAT